MARKKPIAEVLDQMTDELIEKWRAENQNKIWLGAKSRAAVREDVRDALSAVWKYAKERLTPND